MMYVCTELIDSMCSVKKNKTHFASMTTGRQILKSEGKRKYGSDSGNLYNKFKFR